jgi:hypothetical protein
MSRCKSKTKNNKRCKLTPLKNDGEYCHIHYSQNRNYTDKYCEYDEIGLIENYPININKYIEEKYYLKYNPFVEFINLVNTYHYIIPNYNNLLDKLTSEYASFSILNDHNLNNNETKFTVESLNGLTLIIQSLENTIIKNDKKTMEILKEQTIILSNNNKNDLYKTLNIVQFYIDYYIFNVLYYNTMRNINYFSLSNITDICYKVYNKMLQSKDYLLTSIKYINKRETEKNNYIRLLSKTNLPKDIILYIIVPFF